MSLEALESLEKRVGRWKLRAFKGNQVSAKQTLLRTPNICPMTQKPYLKRPPTHIRSQACGLRDKNNAKTELEDAWWCRRRGASHLFRV